MAEKDNAKSWIVLAGVTFTVFFIFGSIKSLGVLLPALTEQLASDTWIIGACISLMVGWGYTIGLLTNALLVRFGPRVVAVGCGIISNVGLIVCACADNVYTFLIGILLAGFLLMQENIMLGVVPYYFDKHYQTAVSIYCCATAIGITIMPLLTQMFLLNYGWRGALLLICGIGLHTIPVGALLHSERPQKQNQTETIPSISKSIDAPDLKIKNEKDSTKTSRKILSLLTNKPFLARVLVPGFVYGYVFNGWLIYIVSFAIANGASLKESSIVASCGGIGVLIIRMSLPFLNKKLTYKHIMYSSSCLGAVSLILTTIFTSVVGMSLTSILFGIAIGALGAEIYIITKDVADEDQYYNVLAVFHLFTGFASITSGIITGLIYDVTLSFTVSFSILAAVFVLAAVSLGLEDIYNMKNFIATWCRPNIIRYIYREFLKTH
ncbi:monocarboxylate transporter 13-like [Amphiura filiformis]|uniref:monocarboxylate transporter 13-like n=1 Tax=Amphiura filiformis TaxID=82378 RepID=UPI003B2209E1